MASKKVTKKNVSGFGVFSLAVFGISKSLCALHFSHLFEALCSVLLNILTFNFEHFILHIKCNRLKSNRFF